MAVNTTGTTFTYNTEVIGDIVSISAPSISVATIDTTTLDSIHRSFMGGTIDSGEVSLEVMIDPGGTDAQKFEDELDASATTAPVLRTCVITFPSGATGSTYTFSAVLTGFDLSIAQDEKFVASITLKVSGAVTVA
tara:strand:+ start:308 stop:715 length:408 start_codon:yes stop_codon:yes gene_type:complete